MRRYKIVNKLRLKRNKRGVSPVFATILMLMIVVIGASSVFNYFIIYTADYQKGQGSSVLEFFMIEDIWFRHVTSTDPFRASSYNLITGSPGGGTILNTLESDGTYLNFESAVTGWSIEQAYYVDAISDAYDPAQIGTHDEFIDMQAGPDGTFDTLTEAETGYTSNYDENNVDFSDPNIDGATNETGTHDEFIDMQSGPDANFDLLTEGETAYTSDYVENNVDLSNPNVDGAANETGTHSAFGNMRFGPDSTYDTLTEANTGGGGPDPTLLNDGFEGSPWDTNWNDISSNWISDNDPVHSGSTSAHANNGNEGYFTSDNIDASGPTCILIDFWYRLQYTESYSSDRDLTLYYYDGSGYDLIAYLGGGSEGPWLHYTDVITDPQYLKTNFRIRFDASLEDSYWYYENVWVDDVQIKEVNLLFFDDFEGDLSNWSTDWELSTSYSTSPTHSVECDQNDNYLISNDLNIAGESSLTITFRYRIDDIGSSDDVSVYYYDGSDYVWIEEIGDDPENRWLTYSDTINNAGVEAQYFINNFRLYIEGGSVDSGEYLWVDDVIICSEISGVVDNFELDLEVQFAEIEDPLPGASVELWIYAGDLSVGESLHVDYWTGTEWSPLTFGAGLDLQTGLNKATVSVTPTTFTIRFKDGDKTSDGGPATSWPIDYAVLHFWNPNFELDLEVQFGGITFPSPWASAELWIYADDLSVIPEFLYVDYWTGSAWSPLTFEAGSELEADLNKASITITGGTFTIRFRDGDKTSDSVPTSWPIDYAVLHLWSENYELDLEVQFTGVSEIFNELRIYADQFTGPPAESLRVDYWTGSAWSPLTFGAGLDLQTGLNTATVSVTSSPFTIRFVDGKDLPDNFQNSWGIDYALLYAPPQPNEFTVEVEFMGGSNIYFWNWITWYVESAWTESDVDVTLQLYNYALGRYAESGDLYGYIPYSGGAEDLKLQTIPIDPPYDPADFRDPDGDWKMKVKGVKSTLTQFDCAIDWIAYHTEVVEAFPVEVRVYNYGDITVKITQLYMGGLRYNINVEGGFNYLEVPPGGHGYITAFPTDWAEYTLYDFKLVTERGSTFQTEYLTPGHLT